PRFFSLIALSLTAGVRRTPPSKLPDLPDAFPPLLPHFLTTKTIRSTSAPGEASLWFPAICPPNLLVDSFRAELGRRSHLLLSLHWSRHAIRCLRLGPRPQASGTAVTVFFCMRRIQTGAGRRSRETIMTAAG